MAQRLFFWLCFSLALLALLLPTLAPAQPDPAQARRVALVVGNGQYVASKPALVWTNPQQTQAIGQNSGWNRSWCTLNMMVFSPRFCRRYQPLSPT